MQTLDAIGRQRVVRAFTSEPLPDDALSTILHAGRRAGSSKNLQRWAFVTVTDRETLRRLSEVGPWCGHIAGATVAIALVTPDPRADGSPLSIMWDLGRAAQNITLAAWDLGIGSCPGTVYEQALCRSILGYPEDHHCEYILSLGYPVDPTDLTRPLQPGGRHDLASMLHEERW
ncbi:MAG: nitroreductase family protein [Chloroflexi bacterium]|nr:nitroreductase family protein [Chloroflexota bacterium]